MPSVSWDTGIACAILAAFCFFAGYAPVWPKRTSRRTPDTNKRPDYYNIQPQKADLTGALYRTKNPNISGAKVLYWLNLMQSCALLDKRLRERKGEPTLWSE